MSEPKNVITKQELLVSLLGIRGIIERECELCHSSMGLMSMKAWEDAGGMCDRCSYSLVPPEAE